MVLRIEELPFTFGALRKAYAQGLRPERVIEEAFHQAMWDVEG